MIPWAERGPPTQLPPTQLADQFIRSWIEVVGRPPSREAAELLLAQILLETNWSKAMWRFNWGNITAGPSWGGDAWRPSWFELTETSSPRDQALHAAMIEGRAPSAFRAYLSHPEGAGDYMRQAHTRFRPMVNAAESGDPAIFVAAIRSSGYCPDCSDSIVQSIRTVRDQIRRSGWLSTLASAYTPIKQEKRRLIAIAVGAAVLAAAAGYGALTAIVGGREGH